MEQALDAGPKGRSRIDVLDVMRGFAVCGMLLVNIVMMGRGVWGHFALPYAGWSTGEQVVFWINELFFEGTSRAVFAMLFGATFMMLLAKSMPPEAPIRPADLYIRRCLWMLVIGIFHATILLWPGDILFHYAAPAMALLPFRNANPKTLIWFAAALLLVLNVGEAREDISLALAKHSAEIAQQKKAAGFSLSDKERVAINDWSEEASERGVDRDQIAEEAKARQTYFGSLVYLSAIWIEWLDFDAFVWALETFTFMIIGIALYKFGVLTGERSTRFYIAMALISLGAGLAINLHETWVKWTTFNGAGIYIDELTYQHGRLAIALFFVGGLVALFRTRLGAFVLQPLKYIGRMALTNYLGQSVIAAILFTGFGLFGRLDNVQLWSLAVVIWVLQAMLSYAWLSKYRMGPCEWVWRSLVYGEAQPLRLPKTRAAA